MSAPQSIESQIAIAQLNKEAQNLREELKDSKDAAQALKEYTIGNFARFEIKLSILIKACTFLATTTIGAIILAAFEALRKK